MSPLYTAEEQREIARAREALKADPETQVVARMLLLMLGQMAAIRSWRRKCAEAERRGMLRAAEIAKSVGDKARGTRCLDPERDAVNYGAEFAADDIESAIRRAAGGES